MTSIRFALRLVLAVVAFGSLYAEPAGAQFKNSPYTETIPDYGTCDVTITPGNASATLKLLNDPTERVFCVAPGDYRAFGRILLTESGTASQRRFLRLDIEDGKRNAVQRAQRALFESIVVLRANWWVVQGLTMQPHDGATTWFLTVWGGDHNVLDGNLVDGIDHVPLGTQDAVVVAGYQGNPATYNTLQGNLVRRGNQLRRPGDYEGILIEWGSTATEANDFNKVLDNEVYDWGSGISIGGYTEDCTEPAVQHGTVIDGNDVYITGAKRIDCNTGALDPNGDCSCAEEGLSQKGNPGSNPLYWTRMTNNRLWGFRPTTPKFSCGGTGANGQAITAGNGCSTHVVAARNIVLDSTQGIVPNRDWVVAGNLVEEIRMSNNNPYNSVAILPIPTGSDIEIQFNTVVGVDSAYDDQSTYTDTACNAVISNRGLKGDGAAPPPTHVTRSNYLYGSSTQNFAAVANKFFATREESRNDDYCFWRKRWTSPEQVCIPFGSTTAASPHTAAAASCNQDLVSAFGLGTVSYPTTQPCNDGLDDDGDGLADWPTDPGCASAFAPTESPECQNGIDDDGDGKIDYDGGASANGGVALGVRDASCPSPQWDQERSAKCGLGAEAVGVLWVLRRLGRRRTASVLR